MAHDWTGRNATRIAAILVLSLSLTIVVGSLPSARAESTYPFKAVFEQDLAALARHTPHVEGIQVIQVLDMERTVVIRISYSPRISESTRIGIENEIQKELQERPYILAVDKNFISCIPEDPSCPRSPGFVIGELLVMFVDVPTDPYIHPWPDGSTLVTSNVGTTSLTLTWPSTKEGSHIVAYSITWALQSTTVPNATHAMLVSGLTPGTIYVFRIMAINDVGDSWLGPNATVMTQNEPIQPPAPGSTTNPDSNRSTSPLLEYWYLFLLGALVTTVVTVAVIRRRNLKG